LQSRCKSAPPKGKFDAKSQFDFEVFLSHSAKDKDTVRSLAERLKNDGLRVWFDEWQKFSF
jgi:hypothetical protein